MTELALPMPVSANVYYRKYRGRMVISEKGRRYAAIVRSLLLTQYPRVKKVTGRLKCEITLHEPDRRRRDLDNFCGKALLDAMQKAGLYEDDSQIDSIVINRGEVVKGGLVKVRIGVIE